MGTETGKSNLTLAIRVIDLTSMWAGPLCTRVLADLGAEVIKIESPRRPDGTRGNPGYFAWLNGNKLGVTLDLSLPLAKECFKRLVALSDIVVENFSPRVMPNFGLDFAALKGINQSLIMLSMPAYGSEGPYANYVSFGPGLEASSGLASLTGEDTGPPLLSGGAYADPVAGLHGVVAVLAALRHRRRTGEGQWIELAQREALSQMYGEAFVLAARGVDVTRSGNRHPGMAPHGCYRCGGDDRWIAVAVRSEAEWHRFCGTIGREWLATDPRFADLRDRKANEDDLDQEIEDVTRWMDDREAVQLLQQAGVPAGMVMDGRGLMEDPHLSESGFLQRFFDVEGKPYDLPGLPGKMIGMGETRSPAPRLGEHNREVLGGLLGLSDSKILQSEQVPS